MSAPAQQEVTQLLIRLTDGDRAVLDELLPLIYGELRRVAAGYQRRESPGHTLQPKALINEAYLRLVDQQDVEWQDRGHFFAVATRVMRHILIDHARGRTRSKRGGGASHVPLDDMEALAPGRAAEIIALDEALQTLATLHPRKCQIVELRFFGGLTVEETAEVLGLSAITIKREWRSAKAWLHTQIANRIAP